VTEHQNKREAIMFDDQESKAPAHQLPLRDTPSASLGENLRRPKAFDFPIAKTAPRFPGKDAARPLRKGLKRGR